MILVKGFCDYYICGKAVDYANDLILDKISKASSASSQNLIAKYKTPMKVAICWLEFSAVLIIATGGWLPLGASVAVGVLGSIPFTKPFLCSLSSHTFKCTQQLSTPQIVASVAGVAIISMAEYGILYNVNPMPSRNYAPISVALSNVALDGGLVITAELLRRSTATGATSPTERSPLSQSRQQPKDTSDDIYDSIKGKKILDDMISSKLQEAQKKIEKYQNLIKQLKMFIDNNPELKQICEEYLAKDQYIVPVKEDSRYLHPKDDIDVMTRASIKGNNLQHTFEQYISFIERNEVVALAFEKHIAADPEAVKFFQGLTQAPASIGKVGTTCKIEEVIG
jgi:hypothetical protein